MSGNHRTRRRYERDYGERLARYAWGAGGPGLWINCAALIRTMNRLEAIRWAKHVVHAIRLVLDADPEHGVRSESVRRVIEASLRALRVAQGLTHAQVRERFIRAMRDVPESALPMARRSFINAHVLS